MIPKPVAVIVGDELGPYYYSHRRLNALFWEAGAPGDPPEGNCVDKVTRWLKKVSDDPAIDDLTILGKVLEEYMEVDDRFETIPGLQEKGRERVRKILAQHGLSYHQGGTLIGITVGAPARSLEAILRKRNIEALDIEFARALSSVETDPPSSITAACAIREALCKVYLEDEHLRMPSKETIKPLWATVQKQLGLDPGSVPDQDIARILSGLTSVTDGIGSLRTHTGSAHGRGRKTYRIEPRHARLAIHAAHTLAAFILETWDARKGVSKV
jgi:hypothetical protein